ncbi:hypothetical protein AALB16_11600 [Lachnospiraceae bacterium 62-35]
MCKNPQNVDPKSYFPYACNEVTNYVRMKNRDIFRSSETAMEFEERIG